MERWIVLILYCLVACTVGCGRPSTSVSGRVTFLGEPLGSGFIIFYSAADKVHQAPIAADGTYTIPSIHPGKAAIAILVSSSPPESENGDGSGTGAVALAKPIAVPQKYRGIETSGLTYDVVEGPQNHDVDLRK